MGGFSQGRGFQGAVPSFSHSGEPRSRQGCCPRSSPPILASYLVIHKGQEWGDHQREAGATPEVEKCRELVAQGLASASGQHQQRGHAWVGIGESARLDVWPSLGRASTILTHHRGSA